jgi:hypothetical protein
VHAHHHEHHHAERRRTQHVVLDIGGDIGALVVHTEPALLDLEVEISPSGDDAARSHKEVLERSVGGSFGPVLVFDDLREGEYTLWLDGVARDRGIRVAGGAVAVLDWRGQTD